MIERAMVSGRPASVAYFDANFNPVDRGVEDFVRVFFDDGDIVTLTPSPPTKAKHLVAIDGGRAHEPRDEAEAQRQRQARFAALKAQSMRLLRDFDEAQHPRDESGKWTSGGGGDGGGSTSTGGDAKPARESADTVNQQAKAGVEAGSKVAQAAGVKPLNGSDGHPLQISTRSITGITSKVTGNSEVDFLQPSVAAMKLDPENYAHDVELFKNPEFYPNLRPEDVKGTNDEVIRHVIDHMKENLRWMYETTPKVVQDRSALWYPGFRKMVDEESARYKLPDASVAAAYAALSPQKDWDQNVYLGDRVLDIMNKSPPWDEFMTARANEMEGGKALAALVEKVKGKSLAELSNPADPWKAAKEKAVWIRIYDESNKQRVNDPSNLESSRHYRIVSPEGVRGEYSRNKDGELSRAAWPSADIISGAVVAIESNGDRKLISEALGARHKVRSFYNNALDPYSRNGDVTVDTHEVGAAWAQPFSANSAAVLHDLKTSPQTGKGPDDFIGASGSKNTGIYGTYGVYADAVRELAAEMHIDPRALQSVTWTAKRERFNEAMTDKAKEQVGNVWDQYRAGDIDMKTAHEMIDKIAPFRVPEWATAK